MQIASDQKSEIRNQKWFPFACILFFLASCSPAPLTAADISAALPTVAAARTLTAAVQPSATPIAPTATASVTSKPAAELTATAQFILTGPHGDGVYQVGVSIAPGTWRAIPQREGYCYWARRKYDGILLGEHYGPPGGEIFVRETDFEVEFDGCGVFVFMGN